MKKMNRKGFTLIEILAVIIIMAILMAIAVPVVTKYINNSKKNNYESSLRNMVSTVNNEIISGHIEDYTFDEENEFLVMPLVCIELEKGNNKKSPFSNYVSAYSFVIVEATENGYSYLVQALDETGYGTYLIKPEEIKIEELELSKLSFITEVDGEYSVTLKNHTIDKQPYVFTCEALTGDSELPSNPGDELDKPEEDSELPSNPGDELDRPEQNFKLLVDKIKLDNNAQTDTYIDFSKKSEETNTNGLYYTNVNTEDNRTTYYFRGNVKNNYIKFGKDSSGNDILWRIVRINEDGSVRMITENIVGSSKYNELYDDNAYVGYMYGLPESTTVYGDVNEDGVFDSKDSILLERYFANWDVELTERQKLIFDFNFDGELKRNDLTIARQILANWSYSLEDYSDAARYNKTHANVTDSTIKTYLDNWYKNNLISYSSYIADAGFCNDRSVAPSAGLWYSKDTALGYAKKYTVYGAAGRLVNINDLTAKENAQPQFKCPNEERDLFSTSSSPKGNNKLTNPIGLLTADEVAYAGAEYGEENESMYLTNGSYYWTMSLFRFSGSSARAWAVGGNGSAVNYFVDDEYGVRPVVNLKSTVTLSSTNPSGCSSQNGTEVCPYIIDTNS